MGSFGLSERERAGFAALLLAVAAVLIAGAWLFWIAGTGPALAIAGLAVLVAAVWLHPSWGTVAGAFGAVALGCLPLAVILFVAAN